ncbi:MAG TPA: hypothetical protein VF267_06450 [Gammaproteobacteria bacterium]
MRNLIRAASRAAVLMALLLPAGCAMYGHALLDVDLAVRQGRPADALAKLEAMQGGFRNEALYFINKGMLLRMNGDLEGSIAAFEAAKPLVSFQEATSVSETVGQIALAEGTTSYQPRAFERLQLHVLQALNQLELGRWNEARVEALQINLLLDRVYGGSAPHGGDAFARYLSGIIFEGLREYDNALIAYRKALEAYDRNSTLRRLPVDLEQRLLLLTKRLGLNNEYRDFVERFGEPRARQTEALNKALRETGSGELIVVAMTGMVPRRHEVSAMQQDITSGKFYRISLPALNARPGSGAGVAIVEDARELGRSEPVEDLSVVARRTLDEEIPGLVARSIARNVIKNRVANEAGEESTGLEFLVNFASAVLENADVRSWSTLPEQLHLLRVRLDAGTHQLRAEIIGAGGGSIAGHELGTVAISRERPVVVSVTHAGY